MGVTLAKGGNVSLSKAAPNLTQVLVGLGWDARSTTGADFDLDASALMCSSGRVLGDEGRVERGVVADVAKQGAERLRDGRDRERVAHRRAPLRSRR